MRKIDKLKQIEKANILIEQRYLKSKGFIKEGGYNLDRDPQTHVEPEYSHLKWYDAGNADETNLDLNFYDTHNCYYLVTLFDVLKTLISKGRTTQEMANGVLKMVRTFGGEKNEKLHSTLNDLCDEFFEADEKLEPFDCEEIERD